MRAQKRNRSSRSRQSFKARMAANAIDQARKLGLETMDRVYSGLVNPDSGLDFRGLSNRDKQFLKRYYHIAVQEELSLKSLRDDILSDAKSDDDKDKILEAFQRIPVEELIQLRKIDDDKKRIELLSHLMQSCSESVGGNSCGHNKDTFVDDIGNASPYDTRQKTDFYGNPLENKKMNARKMPRRPQIIYEFIDRLLFMAIVPDRKKLSVFFKRTTKFIKRNGDYRRLIRSEGRESMIKVMIFLLLYWDPRSMRVGVPTDHDKKEFSGISIKTIAAKTGLTMSRIKAALRNIEAMGFLHKTRRVISRDPETGKVRLFTTQQVEQKDDGSWRGFAVIRVFKNTLFDAFGLSSRGENERKKPVHMKPKTRESYNDDSSPVFDGLTGVNGAADILNAIDF